MGAGVLDPGPREVFGDLSDLSRTQPTGHLGVGQRRQLVGDGFDLAGIDLTGPPGLGHRRIVQRSQRQPVSASCRLLGAGQQHPDLIGHELLMTPQWHARRCELSGIQLPCLLTHGDQGVCLGGLSGVAHSL